MTHPSNPFLLTIIAVLSFGCGSSSDAPNAEKAATEGQSTSPAVAATSKKSEPGTKEEGAATKPTAKADALALPQGEDGPGEVPTKFKGLRELVGMSTKELSNEQLNTFPDPSRGLRWFARHDKEATVRIRSLHALGLYPTDENAAVLKFVATDTKSEPTVRAAALRGMGRFDLEQEKMVSLKEMVLESVKNKDVTISTAAVDAMHGMVTALPILEELAADTKAPAEVRAAAKRSMGPQLDQGALPGSG